MSFYTVFNDRHGESRSNKTGLTNKNRSVSLTLLLVVLVIKMRPNL